MSFEAILAEVAVKCESVVEPVMIDQREAGAIDKAKFLVVVSSYRVKIAFAVCSMASVTRRTLIPV